MIHRVNYVHHGQSSQEWGLPYCKYYSSVKQNDTPALGTQSG